MNNNKRQKLLDKLLAKELERLRKICYKYQRRPLIKNKIIICEADLSKVDDIGALGLYEQIDKKDDLDYTHKISIEKTMLDEYLNYKYNSFDSWAGINKTYYKKRIKDTILHELVHAFVAEEFELWSDIKGTDRDASPVFLSVLYWLGGKSNHHAALYFKKTDMYKRLNEFKNWKEFNIYISRLILKYNKIARELKQMNNMEDKDNISIIQNGFEFSHRGIGLRAAYTDLDNTITKDNRKAHLQLNRFNIGSSITPEKIETLVNKKINNGCFQHKIENKFMVLDAKRVHTIEISKN